MLATKKMVKDTNIFPFENKVYFKKEKIYDSREVLLRKVTQD